MIPPSWEPRTMRSGSPSAAISSSMAMFTTASLLLPVSPDRQSEAGSGLAPLTARIGLADRDGALTGLGAQELQAELVVAVALAQLRAAVEARHDALGRGRGVGGQEGVASAAQIDRIRGRLHHDDLAGIGRAAQPHSCLQLDSHRSPSVGRCCRSVGHSGTPGGRRGILFCPGPVLRIETEAPCMRRSCPRCRLWRCALSMGFRGANGSGGKAMANAPGWKPDPEREDQERYWSGSAWTDRVRPAGKAGSLHLPEHVHHLQRALSAATADIDAVEDRLATLFERSDGGGNSDPHLTAIAPSSAMRRTSVPDPDPPLTSTTTRSSISTRTRTLRATTPSRASPATPLSEWSMTIRRMLSSPNSTRHWRQRSRSTPRWRARRRGGCFAVPDVSDAAGERGQPNGGTIRLGCAWTKGWAGGGGLKQRSRTSRYEGCE